MSRWLDLARNEHGFDTSTNSTNSTNLPCEAGPKTRNVKFVEVSKGGLERNRAEGCTAANPANRKPEICGLAGLADVHPASKSRADVGTPQERAPGEAPPEGSFPRLAYASTDAEDDALALAAIEGSDKSYGAVATTTGMGASRAWRAVDRLQAAGLIDLSYRLIGDEG